MFDKAKSSTKPASAEFRLINTGRHDDVGSGTTSLYIHFKPSFIAGNPEFWVLGQLTSERSKSGDVIGYIGTITDITEQKNLERDRIEAAKELAQQKIRTEQAEYYRRQQEQFIDMICHEIRSQCGYFLIPDENVCIDLRTHYTTEIL